LRLTKCGDFNEEKKKNELICFGFLDILTFLGENIPTALPSFFE
jgi:hypothetical protein